MVVNSSGWGDAVTLVAVARQLEPHSCLWAEGMFRTPFLSVFKTKFGRGLSNLM